MENEFMSLKWFKKTAKKAIKEAAIEQIKLDKDVTSSTTKPYLSVKLVGNVLVVVFNNGDVISRPDSTVVEWEAVRSAKSEQEVLLIVTSEQGREDRIAEESVLLRNTLINEGIKRLADTKDFKIEESHIYLKGTSRSLPPLLVEQFAEVVGQYENLSKKELRIALAEDDEYQGLKRFFMWCCLNPRAEVASDLYGFLNRNSFRITKQGFFVALRNVVTVSAENKDLLDFVSNAYNKVKAIWKKDPSEYLVIKNDGSSEYKLIQTEESTETDVIVGNLIVLYLDLPNMSENRFTDAHTGTFDIRVGQVVNMPMEDCSWSTADCMEAGLHFTSDQIHYVGCGDTSVLVLINPMKVVGIGEHKGRCYEYLPIMTVPRIEATEILHDGDFDTLQLDEQYAIDELESLNDKAQYGFVAEATKHKFNLPSISSKEMKKIVASLSDMISTVNKRVVSI